MIYSFKNQAEGIACKFFNQTFHSLQQGKAVICHKYASFLFPLWFLSCTLV